MLGVAGAVAVALTLAAAGGWLVFSTNSSSGGAAPSGADRLELAARGKEMLIAAERRPAAPPIRL